MLELEEDIYIYTHACIYMYMICICMYIVCDMNVIYILV